MLNLEFDRQLNLRMDDERSKSMAFQQQMLEMSVQMNEASMVSASQGTILLNPELSERLRLNSKQTLNNFIGNSDDFE